MFLRFFLSYNDDGDFRVAGSSGSQRQTGSSHNNYKVPEIVSFDRLKTGLARKLNRESQYTQNSYFTREILINVEDAAMFQLEALCVAEYSYCTYNLETLKIGFGNTQYNAYMATWSGDTKHRARGSSGFINGNESEHFFNYYPERVKKDEPFTYTCPDNFYSQVLDELRQYISYEKNYLFKEITDILERETNFIDLLFNGMIEKDTDKIQYTGTSLQYSAVMKTFDFFMNDDKDIMENKENHTSGLKLMGALCWQMMQISGETF